MIIISKNCFSSSLRFAAIAKELNARELTAARVHLAAGLPLKWVQAQRESFRKYLTQNKIVQFRYKGRQYEVEIAGCTVMPQCYAAVAENLKDFKGMNLLADIGNGTMNIMYLNNGRAMESKSWTEKLGVFQCIQRIRNKVLDETDIAEPYASLMKEAAVSYVQEIFQKLKDYEYNESLMQLHFMGGGARIVEAVGEYNWERTHFNHDICATAKGYEYYCYMILRHNKKCS